MKKNDTYRSRRIVMPFLEKDLLKITLAFFCMFFGFTQLIANNSISQSPKLTLNLENTKVEEVIIKNSTESNMQQPSSVTGKVTDSSGNPLPGATVLIKGTTNGTITDSDGNFSFSNVPSNGTLVFSFIGMKNQEVPVAGKSSIKVVMAPETIDLEEVVAVGYGTQKKASITGSVATIRNQELAVTKNENVLNMLTGKLPGVRVVQKSSAPGDYNTVIDIRSMGTPLFVVDGVTRDQAYFARMDPQEIESISVLKDGSAAIYGLRAANGVILITTKSGTAQNGKVDITYSGNYTAQQFLYVPHGTNAQDYMTLRNESTWQNFNNNYLVRQNPMFTQAQMQPYIDGKPSSNWMDAIFNKTTPEQQHNLNIDGGNDKLRYYMSLSYTNQEGSYKGGGYYDDKWNFRSTVNAQITNRLAARVSIGAILDQTHQPTGTGWSTYKAAWLMRPDAPIYANDNPLYLNGDAGLLYDGRNMVAEVMTDKVGYTINNTRRLNGTMQLSYDIPGIKGLSAKGSYDYAMSLPDITTYRSTYPLYVYNPGTEVYTPSIKNSPSYAQRNANFNFDTDMQLGLYYSNRFAKHNVDGKLIFEEAYSKWDGFSAYRELLIASEYLFAGEDLNQRALGGLPGDRLSQSLIGSFTYDFSGKYLFDFRFRYDGSSRFPEGSRWGFFPSVSAGWRMSEESFIKDNLPMISNLKLRASYGEMGDDTSAGNYPPTLGYALTNNVSWVFNNVLSGGVQAQAIPNPNLTWYHIKMYNLALDFGILDNKLSGTFELYKRDRTGLLATSDAVVPGTVGAALPQENLNADRNFGWELSLDYRNKIRDLSYFVGAQISSTRSMRTDWLEGIANNQYHYWRNRTSGRYNSIWWGNESQHMFTNLEEIRNYALPMGQGTTPGDWVLNDWNGDGTINNEDQHPIATSGLPLFNYGINMGASWKNFDLAANFQGAYGIYAQYGELLTEALAFGGQNTLSYFMDRWHPADPNADYFSTATEWIPGFYPVTGHDGRRTGTNLVQNASYMRLKTLEIGYTLPKNLLSKAGIKNFRVYLSGYNLLTFTGLPNVDPERAGADPATNSTPYVDFYSYPINKTYTLGAVIKF
jgi:TonB-linked SusC/RagA family outer membrane protein